METVAEEKGRGGSAGGAKGGKGTKNKPTKPKGSTSSNSSTSGGSTSAGSVLAQEEKPKEEDLTKLVSKKVDDDIYKKKDGHSKDGDEKLKTWPIYKGKVFASCVAKAQIKTSIKDCRAGLQKCISGEKLESGTCFDKTSVTFKKKPRVVPLVQNTTPVEASAASKEIAKPDTEVSKDPATEPEVKKEGEKSTEEKQDAKQENGEVKTEDAEKKQEAKTEAKEEPKKSETAPVKKSWFGLMPFLVLFAFAAGGVVMLSRYYKREVRKAIFFADFLV